MAESTAHQRSHNKQQDDLRDPGQGVVRDKRGQEQPADKERAQRDSGLKSQKDAAKGQPQSPGQPAHGE